MNYFAPCVICQNDNFKYSTCIYYYNGCLNQPKIVFCNKCSGKIFGPESNFKFTRCVDVTCVCCNKDLLRLHLPNINNSPCVSICFPGIGEEIYSTHCVECFFKITGELFLLDPQQDRIGINPELQKYILNLK